MSDIRHNADGTDARAWSRGKFLLLFNEVMFASNIACAVGYALLIYVSRIQRMELPPNDTSYYFLRSAFRINDLLRIHSISAITPGVLAREFQLPWNRLGYDLLPLASVICVAALILLLLRLTAGTAAYRFLLYRAASIMALFAVPACFLCASNLTRGWIWMPERPAYPVVQYLQNAAPLILIGEILCVGILFIVLRRRAGSVWALGTLLFLHNIVWLAVIWPDVPISLYNLYSPYAFVLAMPFSGIAWLVYSQMENGHAAESRIRQRAGKWTFGIAALAFAVLSALWSPARHFDLAHPHDLNSLTIEMSRGPCFGSCIVYTITVHGNGIVNILQQPQRRAPGFGPQTATLTPEQVSDVLKSLDRANFFSLDGRAFAWGFDSPSVSISVSVDGRTKQVGSDIEFTLSKKGVQSSFVKAAAEIDSILNSRQWLNCGGHPCQQ